MKEFFVTQEDADLRGAWYLSGAVAGTAAWGTRRWAKKYSDEESADIVKRNPTFSRHECEDDE